MRICFKCLFLLVGKIILTIRTAYKDSFHNLLLNEVCVQSYHVNLISKDLLYELSITHGFVLPSDKKLTDILRAPFYLRLYLTLDNIEDAELTALNQEAFEQKIWDEIIRNNRKRKKQLANEKGKYVSIHNEGNIMASPATTLSIMVGWICMVSSFHFPPNTTFFWSIKPHTLSKCFWLIIFT